MNKMESGQMGKDEPKLLMEYRRDILYRSLFYLAPVSFGFVGISAVREMVSGNIPDLAGKLFIVLWLVLATYGVWHLLARWVLDFTCTEAGMEIRTVIGGVTKTEWSSLRRFNRSRARIPYAGWGWLGSEGSPRFYLMNMPTKPMDGLEEVVRSHSNAEVKRSRW